jgi:tRNA pseudouridine synthase 10
MKKKAASGKPAELFRKQLGKKSISSCRKILAEHNLCDNCLGRQMAQLSTGMTNAERGRIIRDVLGGTSGTVTKKKSSTGKANSKSVGSIPYSSTKSQECFICSGFFSNIQRWVDAAADKLKPYEYSTFAVGTKPGKEITKREEEVWESSGIEHCEPFRAESNRELGKALYHVIKKEVDEENPDVLVMLNLGESRIELVVRSFYVSGGYKKLVRGIPQTKWDMYPVSVEDVIAAPFMKPLKAEGHSLHAAGREDIDARCLDFRPFVLEIEKPVKRTINLKAMKLAINNTKKVEVSTLKPAGRQDVLRVKDLSPDKEYRLLVEFESPPKQEKLNQLSKLVGPVEQHTPTRVMHRRADLLRHKNVLSLKWKKVSGKKYEIQIRGDAGLYAKEFVHGDEGRTKPSVAEFLGVKAKVLELDVVKIYL